MESIASLLLKEVNYYSTAVAFKQAFSFLPFIEKKIVKTGAETETETGTET